MKEKIKNNLYEHLFNNGFVAVIYLVLFMVTICITMMFFSDPSVVRVPEDQIALRAFVLNYLPYYEYYSFNLITYFKYSFIAISIYFINILSLILILKTLITGKCSFSLFKGQKLSNIVYINIGIYVFSIPFVFEIVIFTLLLLSLFIIGTTVIIHIWEKSSEKFENSCACQENK